MTVQGALRLAKRYPFSLLSVFLTEFRYFPYQIATQLSSRGRVDLIATPILPEKISRVGLYPGIEPGNSQMADVLKYYIKQVALFLLYIFTNFTCVL